MADVRRSPNEPIVVPTTHAEQRAARGRLPVTEQVPAVAGQASSASAQPRWARGATRVLRRILGRKLFYLSLAMVLLLFFLALFGPLLVPYQPLKTDPEAQFLPPSPEHWMGTDQYGRDIFARLVHATRLDLTISFSVVGLALVVGSLLGAISGFLGKGFDDVMMRVVDVFQSFPAFILAMGMTAVLGNTIGNVILAIAVAYTPYFVRLTRGEMLRVRRLEYADAARSVGASSWRTLRYHLLPNAITPSLVQAALALGWAILDTAGLAFLGLGIRPPTAEWGVMVSDGAKNILSSEWWTWLFPGLAIFFAVFGFNGIADDVRARVTREE
jgi:peptide/nickel transport system permease protein